MLRSDNNSDYRGSDQHRRDIDTVRRGGTVPFSSPFWDTPLPDEEHPSTDWQESSLYETPAAQMEETSAPKASSSLAGNSSANSQTRLNSYQSKAYDVVKDRLDLPINLNTATNYSLHNLGTALNTLANADSLRPDLRSKNEALLTELGEKRFTDKSDTYTAKLREWCESLRLETGDISRYQPTA